MNLLDDLAAGGAWTLSGAGAAWVGDPFPRTSPSALGLVAGRALIDPGPPPVYAPQVEGSATHSIAGAPGTVYGVTFWILESTAGARLEVVATDGIAETVVASAAGAASWRPLHAIFAAPSAAFDLIVRVVQTGPDGILGTWTVDDGVLEVLLMRREPLVAYEALFNRLKGINGAAGGYYHDLRDRVFPVYLEPLQSAAPDPPYVCLPVEDDGAFAETGSDALECTLRCPIYAFPVGSDVVSSLDNSSARSLHQLLADLLRALLPTDAEGRAWDFGVAAILEVAIVSKQLFGQPTDEVPAHLRLVVDIRCRFSRAELGPDAEG